jgi:hypothetical protein
MYDKYRAEDERVVASKPSGIVIQNSAQSPAAAPTPAVVQNSGVVQPTSTCNRLSEGSFCRRDVHCCSGNCYFKMCHSIRR